MLAIHLNVSDSTVHAAMVGAYVPGSLLSIAKMPAWIFFLPMAIELGLLLAATVLPNALSRWLAILSFAAILAYSFVAVAMLFYVAFAPYAP
jgi:hypothetical protein